MIGSVRECEGLYYFDEIKVSRINQFAICNSIFVPSDNKILLCHNRIGHLNFHYL